MSQNFLDISKLTSCVDLLDTINPLTPVLAVTGCDEPWPFFHFWRPHFWSKLASLALSVLNLKFWFLHTPSQNVAKRGAIGKKSELSCCKCLFHSVEANLANLQPVNPQNDFCTCLCQNVANHGTIGKKSKLSCCKCLFDSIEANLECTWLTYCPNSPH